MIDVREALRLYLVADPDLCDGALVDRVEHAIRGGVTMVQLRAKHVSDLELLNLATRLQAICAQNNVPFLVNDRVDIAIACGAAGVHLGVNDLPLECARELGGAQFLIGYSPETATQIHLAADRGADYLGIGPILPTTTKIDAGEAMGIERFASYVRMSNLPVVGIGGITLDSRDAVVTAGAAGIAVVSAILSADDAGKAARQLSRNRKRTSTRGSSDGSQ